MNTIDVNHVLSQIRQLSEQAAHRPATPTAKAVEGNGFGRMVGSALGKVSETENAASKLQTAFELGDPSADLARVMVAQAKAQVSFRAVTEVRNRLVSAYQEIMNMPI